MSNWDLSSPTSWCSLSRQSAVDFPQDQGSSGVCELIQEFGQDWPGDLKGGFSIAVNPSTGDICVTDRHSSQVKVFNSDGTAKFNINTNVGLRTELLTRHGRKSYPKGIVINPMTQDIIVTDCQYVKSFGATDEDRLLKYKFSAVSPSGKASDTEDGSFLSGLTLDANYRLLVGEVRHCYISKHHLNGKHISTIKVRIQPQFIVASPGKIIISSWELNTGIHILDYTGKLLHELTPPPHILPLWFPSGLCISEGTIFVSNVLGIYCFSVTGEYLGCATKDVNSPLGLAVQDGDKLFAVEGTGYSVKVFKLKC